MKLLNKSSSLKVMRVSPLYLEGSHAAAEGDAQIMYLKGSSHNFLLSKLQ